MVAPLNWGLGHATRCIPIIKELLSLQCKVLIAANGNSLLLLRKEFPSLQFLEVPGYKIQYSKRKIFLPLLMLAQAPAIFFFTLKEHVWLKKIAKLYGLSAIISDNRFGMYNRKIFSVYITHQLLIKTGNIFTETLLQKLHYFFIKKYNECWIIDNEINGFAGELSHGKNKPANAKYIGTLSRFELINTEKKYELVVSVSGPEPQRTIFEKIMITQLKDNDKKVLFIRGLPGDNKNITSVNKNIEFINHLSSEDMNTAFLQSQIIISRSGYTTVMDLIKINRNAVLVPTPGQTEQEYLAEYLMKKKYFYCVKQKDFSLINVIDAFKNFSFNAYFSEMNGYKNAVQELKESIRKN